jgi:hypothetical protein
MVLIGALTQGCPAFACILPTDHTYALRPAMPASLAPTELALEIDRKTMAQKRPGLVEFNVKRVVAGKYDQPTIIVSYNPTSCDYLARADTDSIVVGRLSPHRADGLVVLSARVSAVQEWDELAKSRPPGN